MKCFSSDKNPPKFVLTMDRPDLDNQIFFRDTELSDDDDSEINTRDTTNFYDFAVALDRRQTAVENAVEAVADKDYLPKCASHCEPRYFPEDDGTELSERDISIVRATVGSARADQIKCSCLNPRCKIVRYIQSADYDREDKSKQEPKGEKSQNDLNTSTLATPPNLLVDKNDFKQVHEELLALSGGQENATKVYNRIRTLSNGQTRVDTSSRCNTSLMQLCSTTFKDEDDPTRKKERHLLNAQIYALIKLYIDLDPEALFMRNTQEAGALELAALTNKVVVSKYLVMLHNIYGRDVNAKNDRGHTLLHLMARKGDDCVDALEALLKIRLVSEDGRYAKRLFRIDVLNDGKKTPLDVATACVDLFSTGKDRAIYTKVISTFHKTIEEEAQSLESSQPTYTTFLNNF